MASGQGGGMVLQRRAALRAAAAGLGGWVLHASGLALGAGALAVSAPAQAQAQTRPEAPGVEVQTLSLRREDGTVLLDFDLRVHLPAAVEDALNRGVPLYFQATAALFRPRWYWRDARVARVERQWRLSYQPLTGVYRVSLGSIAQNHARLEDALTAVSRLGRWQVADSGQAEAGERHYAEFSWKLDISQLPRPMQFGLGSGTEWSLGVERTLRLEP
ncbi:MAG: DUF4390 domain-containing protein [Betaproteobacteria bacterium]